MSEKITKNKILIIGIAGGLAQITSRIILQNNPDAEIYGVDNRDVPEVELKGLTCIKMKFSRGNFEKLFREHEFDVVYHLARISHSNIGPQDLRKRLELSVMGTSRILDLSLRFGIKKLIVLSTFHVYGALSDNSIFLDENAPLRASVKHAELRDVVEMDQICTNWMWKNQEQVETVVLRPCNIIGSQISNTMSKYLTSHFAIRPLDYNPVFQFIHEFDMANILYRSINEVPTGIYNIAPDEVISIREAKKEINIPSMPLPIFALSPVALAVKKLWNFPDYLLEYIKFSCIIDNSEIKKYIKDDLFRFTTREALELLKLR